MMPRESTSQVETTEASALARPLRSITRLAVRFPRATILLAGLVTVCAVAVTAARLGFRNSRADLLNPHSEYHQRWLAYTKEFGDQEDVVVVVESKRPERVVGAMKDVADALEQHPDLFSAVMHQYDLTRLRKKGLHYLTPEQLTAIGGFLDRAAPILGGDWNSLSLVGMIGRMAAGMERMASSRSAATPEMFSELDRVLRMLSGALEAGGAYRSPWPDALGAASQLDMLGCQPLVTDDGTLGFVMLKLATADTESFDPHTKGLESLREIVAEVKGRNPDVSLGLTGLPVIENDEMRSSQTSMSWASVLSFVGVAFVFLAGFGGWRHPLIGSLALTAGMGWAFGFATLAIGHLNILSSAFGAILIGQGIDFGVYYLAGYLNQRRSARCSSEAIVETAGSVGPGIATGAVSTAIAFFAAGFTEFTGVAELGMIAGGGILLCFVAATVLLPAMLQLSDAERPATAMPSQLRLGGFFTRVHAFPTLTLGVLIGVSALGFVGLKHLRYDHNLMNLQPPQLECVRLAKTMTERTGQNAYYALSMAGSREEALSRKEALLRQPSVARVEEIAAVIPSVDARRQPLIAGIHARLSSLPSAAPQIAVGDARELESGLAQLQRLLSMAPQLSETARRVAQAREAIRNLTPAEICSRVGRYQQRLAADMLDRLRLLRTASDPEPPRWSDISPGLVTRFVGQSGKQLLKVYSRADIWDMPATERFIREVRDVDHDATGNPMQIYEASRQMKRSYEQAAIYATVIVCLVVYLDFGSVWYTLLALLPLGLGMAQMFGVMGLVDLPLNAANMIVLPLILGIGVDNGVHVVHDFRRQRGGQYCISDSTANAVFINSLGNMVGFGSLMIASHQGLQSLGRALTIGMACCLFSALAMPSLLMLMSRRRTTSCSGDAHGVAAPHERPATGLRRSELVGMREEVPRRQDWQ
ncbi:MAG: MMPL family transporter [Planctomycetaceae bacterium]|nr:MMPL family transporter [Planctomycetaceae bacterium]